ncbi:Lon protease [Cytospora mali]|uniref:Lon protease n=1 Tax=Cytospora mali TaxID=578113 RepID=A0A194V3X8_CYTMA|nr:Lon protease [Valsa mali var. pyri (nom. inval.)]
MSPLSPSGSPHAALPGDSHISTNKTAGAHSQSEFTNSAEAGQPVEPILHESPADMLSASGQDAMSRMTDTLENINVGIQQMITIFKKNTTSNAVYDDSPIDSGSEVSSASEDGVQENVEVHEYITGIKECNYRQFGELEMDRPKHVVEILLVGPDFETEAKAWHKTLLSQTADEPVPCADDVEDAQFETSEHKWIQQVRINSRFVLDTLYKLEMKDGLRGPRMLTYTAHAYIRPFALLLHYHQAMQAELQRLSDGYEEANNEATESPERGSKAYPTLQSLAELRCYVDFVESRLMPDFNRYRYPEQPIDENQKIRYDDIWYLFYPGQLIFIKKTERFEATPPASRGTSIFQTIRRLDRVMQPAQNEPIPISVRLITPDKFLQSAMPFRCYNLDFNGDMYGRQSKELFLEPWKGEKRILDLEFFPLCYVKDYEAALQRSIADGKALVNLFEQRHGFYSGWTLVNGPLEEPLVDANNEKIKNSAHIESDVLVDYQETFNTYHFWKPSFNIDDIQIPNAEVIQIENSTRRAVYAKETVGKQTKMHSPTIVYDCAAFLENRIYMEKEPYAHGLVHTLQNEEDFALLVRRFFAYSVWERKFVQLDIRALDKKEQRENAKAFDFLQIDNNHKRLIKSIVQSHFKKKEAENKGNIEMETQDLIRGKGKGVIILLHGVPGVGKTATAEAVAQRWNKPLFPITCGDLGIDAEGVEKSLNGIFRLAHLWDCVLLLDEADVFITQRERRDLARNALVSVLRYDHLTEEQTVKVFELNIERLKEVEKRQRTDPTHPKLYIKKNEIIRFAREHYQRYSNQEGMGRWNGRQIRNAFLIASSLAHYGAREFELVEKTTLLYDEYRYKMYKRTDSERAYEREERNIDFY